MAGNEPYKKGGADYHPGRMQKSFDEWVEEEREEHHMGTDETTEGPSGTSGVNEVVSEPGPKTPEDMAQNPEDVVDAKVVDEMGAKHRFASPHPKAIWDAVTSGATHKITACVQAMQGKVDDPGAFCNWLAGQVGYKPE